MGVGQPRPLRAGNDGNSRCGHGTLGPDLVARELDGLRRWADPDEPGAEHRPGEPAVLGQEAVARMNGVQVAVDAARLVVPPQYEPAYVLQEKQRHAPTVAQLGEVRSLQRRLGEENPVIGRDSHRVTVDPGEAAHQGRSVLSLELEQLRTVEETVQDLPHVVGGSGGRSAAPRRARRDRRPAPRWARSPTALAGEVPDWS